MRRAKLHKVKLDSPQTFIGRLYSDDLPEHIQEMLGLAEVEFPEELELIVDTDKQDRAQTVYILETSIDVTRYIDLDDLDEKIQEEAGSIRAYERATGMEDYDND